MLHRGLLAGPPPADAAVPDWPQRFRALHATARDPRLKAYYGSGAPAGDAALATVPLVAVDFETTGLDPARDEIVSIALVPMTLAQIHAGATRHWIVRPRGELAATSVVLHGITHSQVADAPDLDDVLQPVFEAMAGRVLVVHYRELERGFLDAALRQRIGEGIEFPVIDTMDLEARLHRRPPPHRWPWQRRAPPPLSIRLADSRTRYGLPVYRAHHAPTDALATAELLQAQVADRFSPQTPLAALWR